MSAICANPGLLSMLGPPTAEISPQRSPAGVALPLPRLLPLEGRRIQSATVGAFHSSLNTYEPAKYRLIR